MSVCVFLYFYTFCFFCTLKPLMSVWTFGRFSTFGFLLHFKNLNVCLSVWTFVRFLFMYLKSLENSKRTAKVNKPFIC